MWQSCWCSSENQIWQPAVPWRQLSCQMGFQLFNFLVNMDSSKCNQFKPDSHYFSLEHGWEENLWRFKFRHLVSVSLLRFTGNPETNRTGIVFCSFSTDNVCVEALSFKDKKSVLCHLRGEAFDLLLVTRIPYYLLQSTIFCFVFD